MSNISTIIPMKSECPWVSTAGGGNPCWFSQIWAPSLHNQTIYWGWKKAIHHGQWLLETWQDIERMGGHYSNTPLSTVPALELRWQLVSTKNCRLLAWSAHSILWKNAVLRVNKGHTLRPRPLDTQGRWSMDVAIPKQHLHTGCTWYDAWVAPSYQLEVWPTCQSVQ